MELQMLKEARDRDRAQIESTTSSASENQTKIASSRDAARAEAQDMERQLAATLADLELARADYNRAMLSSANLQRALEAFQNEREAETGILEEQARSSEEATAAAHAATLTATVEANEAQMKAVQYAADAAIRNIMDEVKTLEQTVQVSHIICVFSLFRCTECLLDHYNLLVCMNLRVYTVVHTVMRKGKFVFEAILR
jgi:hypothetical protein